MQKERDNTFTNDPLSNFVIKFRTYCQHFKLPELIVSTKVSFENNITSYRLMLSKERLLLYDGWGSIAKQFLVSSKGNIDILDVFTQYEEKVLKFYTWFQSRQAEIHAEELQLFEAKQAEVALLDLEDKIDVCFNFKEHMPYLGEEIFLSFFSSKEFELLEHISPQSPERAQRAIELLSAKLSIPETIKDKILLLYKEPGFLSHLTKGQ